jgi:hypothetical protein
MRRQSEIRAVQTLDSQVASGGVIVLVLRCAAPEDIGFTWRPWAELPHSARAFSVESIEFE